MADICGTCGTQMMDGVCPKCAQLQQTAAPQDERFKRFFMDPKERLVTTLGNSYIQWFLKTGMISKGFSVVSDKRAYFQGTTYEIKTNNRGKKKVSRTHKSRTVDLKDVTGTGIDSYSEPSYLYYAIVYVLLWLGFAMIRTVAETNGDFGLKAFFSLGDDTWLLLFMLIIPVLLIYAYIRSRKHYITIQFAGGEIAFDMNWFSQKEMDDFQRNIRLAKDKALEDADFAMASKLQQAVGNAQPAQANAADQLAKYADLLSKNLISQEEFERLKRELIG